MNNQNYTATIEVAKSPEEVFNHLKDVSKWWGKQDFKGNSSALNDEFIIKHGDVHYSKQKLIEVVPNRKMVWLVTESKLDWIKEDKNEWTNTRMVFELTPKGDRTELHFTHEGLVPGKECYAKCEQGWNIVIKEWLFNFIMENKNDFTCSISAKISTKEAFQKICNVSAWWGTNVEGHSEKMDDIFTIHFGETWVTFKIAETIPGKRIVWEVTNSCLPWLKDKTEWTNTQVVWEISQEGDNVKIDMTHAGLVPAVECYENCEKGWNFYVKDSLFKLLTEGKGSPDKRRQSENA